MAPSMVAIAMVASPQSEAIKMVFSSVSFSWSTSLLSLSTSPSCAQRSHSSGSGGLGRLFGHTGGAWHSPLLLWQP